METDKISCRKNVRLDNYDYRNNGAYFLTICTRNRECILSEVINNEVHLSDIGVQVANAWHWLSQQYQFVKLDAFVVMPNHVHGILMIQRENNNTELKRKPLGGLIGAFRTTSSKSINVLCNTSGTSIWQRGYFEHVIRSERELMYVREYILNNPRQWTLDVENPTRQNE